MDQTVAITLASLFSFWKKLDNETQANVLIRGQYIRLPVGHFVCIEGDMCNHLPLIISGSVRVYKTGDNGREITLYYLDRGDSCILTASSIISQQAFPAFAVTEAEVEALLVPANSLKEWVMHDAIWQEYIFGLLSQRLDNVIEIVEEVAFRRLDSRIATYLLKKTNDSLQTLQTTHEAIAQELGSSREVVSRILKTFEKQGLLSLSRGHIELKNRSGIEKNAQK